MVKVWSPKSWVYHLLDVTWCFYWLYHLLNIIISILPYEAPCRILKYKYLIIILNVRWFLSRGEETKTDSDDIGGSGGNPNKSCEIKFEEWTDRSNG